MSTHIDTDVPEAVVPTEEPQVGEPAPLPRSLPAFLALRARETPERVALREKRLGIWREISWAEYYRNVQATAHALHALGVRPGDHVAILSDNRPEWVYVDLAAQGIGARSVGIYHTSPAGDVAYILDHSQSVVLACEDQEQVGKAVEVAAQTPTAREVVIEPGGTRGSTARSARCASTRAPARSSSWSSPGRC